MNKLVALILALIPSATYAHLDHAGATYSFFHYFTGSHLVVSALAALFIYLSYRVARRILTK